MRGSCRGWDGTGVGESDEVGLRLTRADPKVHVDVGLMAHPLGRALIEDVYAVKGPCPADPTRLHAIRRERPLPSYTWAELEARARALGVDVVR